MLYHNHKITIILLKGQNSKPAKKFLIELWSKILKSIIEANNEKKNKTKPQKLVMFVLIILR